MQKSHPHVRHPNQVIAKHIKSGINAKLALGITKVVGTMQTAYVFAFISLMSLPAVLVGVFPSLNHFFPRWLIAAGLIALVGWISSYFLQLVLLPVIIVGQNVIQIQNDAKAEVDHETLTYLATLQDGQMVELKQITELVKAVKNAKK